MSERITHDGIVTKVEPGVVTVKIQSTSACGSCHAKGLCQMSEKTDKDVVVKTRKSQEYRVGETVDVFLTSGMGLKAVLYAYVLSLVAGALFFFLGSLLGVIVYNIGKTIGAYLAGYRLSYLCISGVCWDASRPAKRLYFDGSQFLEIHSRYAPKDDDLNRNPIAMFLGGFAFWAIVFAVVMAVAFTAVSSQSIVRSGMIWGAAFSGDYIIYQLCPFRQDYAADMFSLVSTRNAEDRRAFNLYYYNRGNEFADREMLVPDFTAYDSYWTAKTMIYLFRSHLSTKGEIDQALETFPRIHEVSAYLNDEEKAQVAGERIFVLLLLNDRAGADNLFIELSKTVKGEVIRGNNLGSMRTALLVSGAIVGREDTTVDNVKSMKALMVKNPTSHKLQTEQSYYRLAYAKVKEIKPGFNLPALPEAAEQN